MLLIRLGQWHFQSGLEWATCSLEVAWGSFGNKSPWLCGPYSWGRHSKVTGLHLLPKFEGLGNKLNTFSFPKKDSLQKNIKTFHTLKMHHGGLIICHLSSLVKASEPPLMDGRRTLGLGKYTSWSHVVFVSSSRILKRGGFHSTSV